MKIKRYTGSSTREVLARIRNDLGPDAVILSNREIVGGVELMAAVDFDATHLHAEAATPDAPAAARTSAAASAQRAGTPARQSAAPMRGPLPPVAPAAPDPALRAPAAAAASRAAVPAAAAVARAAAPASAARTQPAPQAPAAVQAGSWSRDLEGLRDELQQLRDWVRTSVTQVGGGDAAPSPLLAQLQALGFSALGARGVAAGGSDLGSALRAFAHELHMPPEPLAEDGVYALVGATGVGKTTTIAKLAARLVLRHGTDAVALITTDTYRIGGVDQLKIYGRILGVPVAVARDAGEIEQQLAEFADRRFVLIDTIGLSPRDERLGEQLRWLHGFGQRITRLLLVNGGLQLDVYDALWRAYRDLPVDACILTKIDETPTFGAALQWLHAQRLPLWFFTDGQRVPEDLHVASATTIADQLQRDAVLPDARSAAVAASR